MADDPKPPPKRKFCREAKDLCKTVEHKLDHLVLAEEDEQARFRRRMHIHLCMIGASALLALMSIWSLVDASSVIFMTLTVNSTQEFFDYVGKF